MNERPWYRPSRRTTILVLLLLAFLAEVFVFRFVQRPKEVPVEVLGIQIAAPDDLGDSASTTLFESLPRGVVLGNLLFEPPAKGLAPDTSAAAETTSPPVGIPPGTPVTEATPIPQPSAPPGGLLDLNTLRSLLGEVVDQARSLASAGQATAPQLREEPRVIGVGAEEQDQGAIRVERKRASECTRLPPQLGSGGAA